MISLKSLLVSISLCLLCYNLISKTIEVGVDGSKECSTIQAAVNIVDAGDTIKIYSGIYNEAVTISTSGSLEKPITIMAVKDTLAIIDGTGFFYDPVSQWGEGLIKGSWGVQFINIIGLKVQNSQAAGIMFTGGNNIHISKCKTFNTFSSGIGVWESSSITID